MSLPSQDDILVVPLSFRPHALVPKRRGRSWAASPHPLGQAFPLAEVPYPEGQKEQEERRRQ